MSTSTSTGQTATDRVVLDTLGVQMEVGDLVRVTSWGAPVRLIDTGRIATVAGFSRTGNVVLDEGPDEQDPIARGRSVRPGHLAVMRRDGQEGFEGNAWAPVGTVVDGSLLHSATAASREWECSCGEGERTIDRASAFSAAQTHIDSLKDNA
jgi:hypothetical protein